MLADQLAGVGSPVSNQRLVLQLVVGLNDAYDNVASLIQQRDPLPPFYTARSMLTLEESRKSQHLGSSNNALLATSDSLLGESSDDPAEKSPPPPRHNQQQPHRGRGRGGRGGRGTGGWSRGRGRPPSQFSGHPQQPRYDPSPYYFYGPQYNTYGPPPSYGYPPPWSPEPCPYPTAPPRPSQCPPSTPGLLGPRPIQAYAVTVEPGPAPYEYTDIDSAMHTMTLAPPDDNWYMDTGATSHMTGDSGTLSSYFNSSINKTILVGNGNTIPVYGDGHKIIPSPSRSPVNLKNVLHAPQIIKNLTSVRKFTTDNHVSMEFDPFGFHVKDLLTGNIILRCDSTGDLYPLSS